MELPFARLDEKQILLVEEGCGADPEFHLERVKFEMPFRHPEKSCL